MHYNGILVAEYLEWIIKILVDNNIWKILYSNWIANFILVDIINKNLKGWNNEDNNN